jgi:membrane protease YdiL (CAAX protease family)
VSIEPDSSAPDSGDKPSTANHRILALLEILLCSGFPTQIALGQTFVVLGFAPFNDSGGLNTGYVVGVSLADTLLVIALVLLFLVSHGERPRDVIAGRGSAVAEAAAGIPLIFVALAIAMTVLILTQLGAPWLHTVARNPLQDLVQSRRDAWLFALVVIVAGGIREEVQRAFMLHRFDVWLGGGRVGVLVTSAAFGAGHLIQGADAALATGLLGAFWGVVYLRRRSAIAPMVSHAGFDLLQILQFLLARGTQVAAG